MFLYPIFYNTFIRKNLTDLHAFLQLNICVCACARASVNYLLMDITKTISNVILPNKPNTFL